MEISAWKEGARLDEGSLSSSTYRFDRNEKIKKFQQISIGMCDSSSDDHVPLGDLHKCHTMRADSLAQSSSKKKPRDVSSGNRLSSTSASSPKKLPSKHLRARTSGIIAKEIAVPLCTRPTSGIIVK